MASQFKDLPQEGSSGDVVGPASATSGDLVMFSGSTGKVIADTGITISGGMITPIKYIDFNLIPNPGAPAIGRGRFAYTNDQLGSFNAQDHSGALIPFEAPTIYTDHLVPISSANPHIDISNGQLQTGSGTSVDWGNYWLVTSSGNTSVDYGNRVLKDGDSSVVMDWNAGYLTIPGGSPTVAWEAYALHGSSSFVTVDWDALRLTNNSNQTVVDWAGRVLYADFGGNVSVLDWENLLLLDSGAITSLDWGNNRTTYDSNGIQSVGWGARNLFNTSGVIVTDFNNLQFFDAASFKAMDWGQRYLYNSANQIVGNWNTGILQDTTPITSLDWLNRILYDNSNNQSLNYQSRILKDTASGNSINYGTRSFYDTAGAVAANYNNNLATLKASGFSLTAQRVTATNAGSYTIQVSAAAVIVHIAAGGTIATYTLTLPASTNLVDGQRYTITTDGTVTALTLTAGSGTTLAPTITSLTKAAAIRLIYDSAGTIWLSA